MKAGGWTNTHKNGQNNLKQQLTPKKINSTQDILNDSPNTLIDLRKVESTSNKAWYELYNQKELRKMDLCQIEREVENLRQKLEAAMKAGTISNGKKFEVSKNEIVHEFLHDSEDEHAVEPEIAGVGSASLLPKKLARDNARLK